METEKAETKSEVIVVNPKKLEQIKEAMKQAGVKHLHILADFDRTLTQSFVNGEEVSSIISVLRDDNYLSPDYAGKAQVLHDKYFPMEIDPNLAPEKKKQAMAQWWRLHFELLIKSGLSKKDLDQVLASAKIALRAGVKKFLQLASDHDLPLIIMSASGLGDEMIEMILKKEKCDFKNIHVVSNSFVWDKNGKAVAVNELIIHVANKDETVLSNQPFFKEIRDRENVILLGDNIEDVAMAAGLQHTQILKIGFLNKNIDENLEKYKDNFDIIITNDGPMDFVNSLLAEILKVK